MFLECFGKLHYGVTSPSARLHATPRPEPRAAMRADAHAAAGAGAGGRHDAAGTCAAWADGGHGRRTTRMREWLAWHDWAGRHRTGPWGRVEAGARQHHTPCTHAAPHRHIAPPNSHLRRRVDAGLALEQQPNYRIVTFPGSHDQARISVLPAVAGGARAGMGACVKRLGVVWAGWGCRPGSRAVTRARPDRNGDRGERVQARIPRL
jgi:hypothetical protein